MTLKLTKSTTLNGESIIDGITVVTLLATISAETAGNTYITQNIINQDIYNANKRKVRKDMSEFQDAVYEVEDAEPIIESDEEEEPKRATAPVTKPVKNEVTKEAHEATQTGKETTKKVEE